MFKIRHLLPLAALAAVLGYAVPSSAETIIDEWATVKAPSPPELKSVTLDPKTTAILVVDMLKQTCNEQRRPRCVAAIPKIEKLLAAARANGVAVIYSLFPSPSPATFPNPVIGDDVPALAERRRARCDSVCRQVHARRQGHWPSKDPEGQGITTLVPVGTTPHNGVLFTSVLAALRGFNVAVPVDGMAGNNAYEDQIAAYTLANSIVYKVTLTSIDMVKFQ